MMQTIVARVRIGRLLACAQHSNVLGSFYLCRKPVFICDTPTDWPANPSPSGLINCRCEISRRPGEIILNMWQLNMDIVTYGGTIRSNTPATLTETTRAAAMCDNLNQDKCRFLGAPPNLYSGSYRPGSGGEINRLRSGITTHC